MEEKDRVLEANITHLKERLDNIEEDVEKLKEDVGDLKTNAGEMKVYISQIFNMLDDIKTQIALLRDIGDKTREKGDNQWLDFFKTIVFLVLGGLITYFFKK